MNLLPHQEKILRDKRNRIGIFHECGTGKSATAIKWCETRGESVLIVTPKSVVYNWIEKEIPRWMSRKMETCVLSKETFRRDWDKLPKYDCLVLDELHYWSGYQSQMFKNLMKYIQKHDIKYIIGLTGTPYLSTPFNLYALGLIMGQEWKWWKFKEAFFYNVKMGNRIVPVPKKGKEQEMIDLYKRIGDFCTMAEVKEVPEHVYENEYFQVTKAQARRIDSLNDVLPIVRYSKIFQIVNGTLKGDDYTESEIIGGDKFDRTLDLISNTKKLIVVCRHTLELKALLASVQGLKTAYLVDGSIDSRDRKDIFDKFSQAEDAVILIQASVSEGYTCQAPVMVFYSLDWSLKNYIQMMARCVRMDNLQSIVYKHLIVGGTIDEDVYTSVVLNKKDFHVKLYE